MDIDHIFIFTDDKGNVADKLVAFGLTESGSHVHGGQGTTNRMFVFDNFYLEILWVHDAQEIKSDNVLPAGLWTRANFKSNGTSPFVLCIHNTNESNALFKHAFAYQPGYFPNEMTIGILNNTNNLCLPCTFRLPFRRDRQKQSHPASHKNGIQSLTKAEFQFAAINDQRFLDYFESEATIRFFGADEIWLTLTFDNQNQGLTKKFRELKLTINY